MQSVEAAKPKRKRTVVAAIYVRVSTVDQGQRGFSIPEQRKACLEKAATLAGSVGIGLNEPVALETHVFVDTAGGDLIERPELTRAREFVKESHPDFFICLDPDRFSRATYQAILVANEIEAAGCRLEFVQHDYQATSEGRLFFTLRVAIAEYEKAKILERTARGKRGKMAAGGIPHRLRAYGYEHISEAERHVRVRDGKADPGTIVPNAAEVIWVRQMYKWVVQEEIGSMAIAERLNDFGVPAKSGGKWHRGVVNDIIHSPLYIGRLRLNRFDFTGLGGQLHLPKEKRTKKLTPKQRPQAEWITVAVPATVDRDLWDRAQRVLAHMKRRSCTRIAPGRKGHLLSGLATCGLCGAPMHYTWNKGVGGYLLRCANRYPAIRGMKNPPPPCRQGHIKAVPVEAEVVRRVDAWFDDPDLLEEDLHRQQAEPAAQRDAIEQNLASVVAQIHEAKARQSRVVHLVSKGVVHADVAEAQLGEINRFLGALEHQQAILQQQMGQTSRTVQGFDHVVRVVRDTQQEIREAIALMDLQQLQMLMRMLLKMAVVHSKDVVHVVPIL